MADYWKSTPRYWCKHCKQYVKDTPLEKRNHEASPRHQGNLQRFIKDLHKSNERETREAQRAKDEVARLKGVVGSSSNSSTSQSQPTTRPTFRPSEQRQATVQDRKKQMEQLAAMGVVVPEEFRKENAIVGDWLTTTTHTANPSTTTTGQGNGKDGATKSSAGNQLGYGVRKRKVEDDDEPEFGESKRKPNWGSDLKSHAQSSDEADLDALLSNVPVLKPKIVKNEENESKAEHDEAPSHGQSAHEDEFDDLAIKKESETDPSVSTSQDIAGAAEADDDFGSMFKKRKGKIRNQ